MARNLVTELVSSFPCADDGTPHLSLFRNDGFQYILQFEDGDLIGAVAFGGADISEFAALLLADAAEAPDSE
jgi:hypothetical protein